MIAGWGGATVTSLEAVSQDWRREIRARAPKLSLAREGTCATRRLAFGIVLARPEPARCLRSQLEAGAVTTGVVLDLVSSSHLPTSSQE